MVRDPAISVIMPVYNARPFLKKAINSILHQTFHDFEFLIFDDGSNDGSVDVLSNFKDARIKLFKSDSNKGYLIHLNVGLSLARGRYIARMDADDIAYPEKLKQQFQFMEANETIGLLGTSYREFGEKENIKHVPERHEDLKLLLLWKNVYCHSTVMIRKSVLTLNGLNYESDYYTSEDYRLWSKISSVSKIAGLDIPLLDYRVHSESISSAKKDFQRSVAKRIQDNNIADFLKIQPSDEDLEIYKKMIWHEQLSMDELKKLGTWMSYLILRNNEIKALDSVLFKDSLCNRWTQTLMSNLKKIGEYKTVSNLPITISLQPKTRRKIVYNLLRKKVFAVLK